MSKVDLDPIIKSVQYELKRRGLYFGKLDGLAGAQTWPAIATALGSPKADAPGESPTAARESRALPDPGADDARSEKNIATLLPFAQPVAREFLAAVNARFREFQNNTAKIISGTRTYSEQDRLYAQGRTADGPIVTHARGGYSNHNFGIAFDIGLFDDRGNYLADSPLYDIAGEIGKSLGLSWGGDWAWFQDKPHFELRPAWAAELTEGDMMVELRRRTTRGEAVA